MTPVQPLDPIRAVRRICTRSARQRTEHRFGTKAPLTCRVPTSRGWVDPPVQAFVIEHEQGLGLFDAGLGPEIVSAPNQVDSALGRAPLRRIFRLNVWPEDPLTAPNVELATEKETP